MSQEQTSLTALKKINAALPPDTQASFFTVGGFDLMQRGANLLASSTLVPAAYRNDIEDKKTGAWVKNPNAMSNCVLALNMSQRMGADPLMVMQNLYIVEGRPAWSSQFIIAAINACGKFSPLRFRMEDKGEKEVEWTSIVWEGPQGQRRKREVQNKVTVQNRECTAWAIERATGERLDGPTVSMEMAVQEGWFGKNGSKWQTMPDVMLRYRAASFFGKLYAPELLMGIQTAEEVHDAIDLSDLGNGAFGVEGDSRKPMTTADMAGSAPAAPAPKKEEASPDKDEVTDPSGPKPDENAERQERNKERAAQLAALNKLREEALTAWLNAGFTQDAAEKMVNTFAAKWNTAQCQRVLAEIQNRLKNEEPQTEQPVAQTKDNEIICPRTERPIDDWECAGCRERNGCPAWIEE